jgi:hypothetical protein
MSANYVEKAAVGCAYAADRIRHDYDRDLAFFTFDDRGYLHSGVIWMQLKATDNRKKTRDGSAIVIRLQRKDLLAWIEDAYPVTFVVDDARRDSAYGHAVQNCFPQCTQ